MGTPQQPELRRSERGATDPRSAKAVADSHPGEDEEPQGWVPPDNRPGHRPEQDQDKPDSPPGQDDGD